MTGSRKIILHCGAPKTASTSLQHYFCDQEQRMAGAGVFFPRRFVRQRDVDPVHQAFRRLQDPASPRRAERRAALALADAFDLNGAHTLFISNESCLGAAHRSGAGSFYPDLGHILPRLRTLFAGYEITVLMVIRNPRSFIPSYYGQEVRRGLVHGFDHFAGEADRIGPSWQPVIGALRDTFGADHVRVASFEAFQENPAAFVADFFAPLSRGWPDFDPKAYAFKPSPGLKALKAMTAINRLNERLWASRSERFRRRLQFWLRGGLYPMLEATLKGTRAVVPADIAARFDAGYRADHEALGLDRQEPDQ